MNKVAHNMETIQRIFREVQHAFSPPASLPLYVQQLNDYDSPFRSIAFEAASMCLALEDMNRYNQLKTWLEFLSQAAPHATQIHVGLGWALAQLQLDPLIFFAQLEPFMRYRVLDGYGYFEGIFRKRKSILSQERPAFSDAVALAAYDQGLGRSIWYLNQGSISGSKNLISRFPIERQPHFWRGLGIAITYVGGLEESDLNQIIATSSIYKNQLLMGAIMTAISRNVANTINPDIEFVLHHWLAKTVREVGSFFPSSSLNDKNQNAYDAWLRQVENRIELLCA